MKKKFKIWIPYLNQMMFPKDIHTIHHEQISGGMTMGQFNSWVYLQWSGLKDKKGNEIYEGDIPSKGNVVEMSFGCFNINGDTPLNAIASKIEIIGNVFQHKHLIK